MDEVELGPGDLEIRIGESAKQEKNISSRVYRTLTDACYDVFSVAEDSFNGFVMGLSWPTPFFYEYQNTIDCNQTLPYLVLNSGGRKTCDAVAEKYNMHNKGGLITVQDVSKAVYYSSWAGFIASGVGHAAWLWYMPWGYNLLLPRVMAGMCGNLIQGAKDAVGYFRERFLNKETIPNQDEEKLTKMEKERPNALGVAAQENEKRETA